MTHNPWALYDALIEAIPTGIAVTDYCVGAHWSYVEARCGMGISKTVRGGGKSEFRGTPTDLTLKELAGLSKSWNWLEASLGVAALNAYYATPENVKALGGTVADGSTATGREQNPFSSLEQRYAGKNVVVVGHFPNVEKMHKVANVTVLERNCSSPLDVPDSACEFIVPQANFVFMTGTTLTNKTAPRLLSLASGSFSAMVGPSAVPAAALLQAGCSMIAGSVVIDFASAKAAVKGGSKADWRAGIKKFEITK